MSIRPKTTRRLLFLLAVIVLVAAFLAAVFAVRLHRNNLAFRRLHDDAMAAYMAGDYSKAVGLLQDYLGKTSEPDPNALFAFAKSRAQVPLPQGRHLAESIRSFNNYLESFRPGDRAAQRELLKVYVQAGYNVEAARLADVLLADNPRDAEILWQKVWALVGQAHYSDALAVNLKLDEIDPLNLTAQEQTLALMAKLNEPSSKLIDYAQSLRKAHDQDPRFEVLLAAAYTQAAEEEDARKWLLTAATRVPPDVQFVVAMVASLDKAGLYSDSVDFLLRAADVLPDVAVQRLLAQRLWQNGKLDILESRLRSQDPEVASADGLLIGYRALALYALNKYADAEKLVDGFAHRPDAASAAWAIGLRAEFSLPALNATDRVSRLQQAVARDDQNPVLHLMLAQSYLRTGEADLTIQQCDQAYQLAPSWAMPHVVAVDALIANARNNDAVATAREAYRRAPDRYETQAALARSSFALACDTDLTRDYAALLPLLEHLQTASRDSQTLPIYVTALARAGKRDEAIAAARSALNADPPLSTAVLTNLAQIADAEKLDVGPDIREAARKAGGTTAELAYADARALLAAGKAKDGLTSLLESAKGHETELAWRMVIAGYKEVSGEGNALADWIALGDEHPENLQLQQAILRAPSRLNDRDFWYRTIERLKKLAGEEGIAWRIERGRWLLSGDLSERDKAEAVNLLTQVTRIAPALAEPHRLLALAMEKVANTTGAITELIFAAEAHPGDLTITRELVGLLVSVHRNSDAVEYLDKLAHNPRLTHEARSWLVEAYVEQGANDKALAALRDETGDAAQSVEHRIMLARLDRRTGRGDDAAKIYLELLSAPVADPRFWTDAANFFADRHDLETADQFLQKLSTLPLAAGQVELDRGMFAEQWVGSEEALKQYKSATAAAPRSSPAWEALANYYVRHGQYPQAAAVATDGLTSLPESAPLKRLLSIVHSLEALADRSSYQILADALAQMPQDPGLNEMLSAVVAAEAGHLDPAHTAQCLRDVADRYPQNIAVAAQAIQSQLGAGSTQEAIEMARRTAQANPNSADVQRLLTEVYGNTADWTQAEQSALLWKQKSMDHPLAADMALARIYLRSPKKNPAAAIEVLAPHVAPGSEAQNPAAFNLYLAALVLSGKSADASTLLKPLISQPHWRSAWLDLADLFPDASTAAAWIEQIRPAIPPDSADDRYAMANAQYRVGVKFDSADALQTAAQTLQPELDANSTSTRVWMLAAQIAHSRTDYPAAERAYRRVLSIEPSSTAAKNNLAYVLLIEDRHDDLPEALKLAREAVASQPADASFHDTLARIQERSGDHAAAIQSFHDALSHDPNSLEAMIGLADLLSRDPTTRDQARDLLRRIEPQLDATPHMPPMLRRQYEAARDTLASSF